MSRNLIEKGKIRASYFLDKHIQKKKRKARKKIVLALSLE
ncbi:hypothetical protein QG37_06340 [Candidozyma auris]|uniref:Uncharacterized protein n=1 Tax=Candidozyma auris TaxID=498019 RepID=A0A0L0NT05_CANAR|nr:hypothetical protein QG37_06340 [[Candida] auris]